MSTDYAAFLCTNLYGSFEAIHIALSSLVILGAWAIWNHRNRCVFDHACPSMVEVLTWIEEERRLWMMAGARGLSYLTAPLPGS
jgi:hypothetical protein